MKNKVTIINPCNQNWAEMLEIDNTKFCVHCKKSVVDFTTSNKYDILKTLNRETNICGRISQKQIDEINALKTKPILGYQKWLAVFGLGSLLGVSEPIAAQVTKMKVELFEVKKDTIVNKNNSKTLILKGMVIDNDSIPLAGTNVYIKGTTVSNVANFDGEYKLDIPDSLLTKATIVTFEYIGLITQNLSLKSLEENSYIVTMEEDTSVLEEVIWVGGIGRRSFNPFRSVGNFFKDLFRRKSDH